MKILGIETSCDETAVCVIDAEGDSLSAHYRVLGNALLSQAALHAQYGGVFPNLAKREHAKNLVPLLAQCLEEAELLREEDAEAPAELKTMLEREPELFEMLEKFLRTHGKPDIDAIAVTAGPGLEPALWVGVNFAKALSTAWKLPIVPVNHMEGHVIMSLFNEEQAVNAAFPVLALLISGGHTELVLSREFGRYERIGETRDDAAGEAFDKVARMLDLPYPGGPEISRLAKLAREQGLEPDFTFTRPMLHDKNYDFSFSGLKTAVRTLAEKHAPLDEDMKMKIAREFEDTVADTLVTKTMRAAEEFGAETIVVGGGVSANDRIRELLMNRAMNQKEMIVSNVLFPKPELATDNAIMIALAGYFRANRRLFSAPEDLKAAGNWRLGAEA